MKVIIADTSCLIIYHKIDQLIILQNTFSELIVTKEVSVEFGELPNWVVIKEVENKEQYLKLADDLGIGEASSIALALELGNSLLIIDEKKGRKVAGDFNLEIIGSLGVLIKAKEMGVIKSVRAILILIDKTNFRISSSIREKVLKEAGELE